MPYGTLTINDLLASTLQTIAQVGESEAYQAVETARVIHNQQMMEAIMDFVEDTTDRLRRFGGGDNDNDFDYVDQGGRADASKVGAGYNVGFPLRKVQKTMQWNSEYFNNTTPPEFAGEVNSVLNKDATNVFRAIRTALFRPTNYTFTDVNKDKVTLPVKAFLNADGADIPVSNSGQSFDATTHTHYLARVGGSLAQSDVDALISTVVEHADSGTPILEINRLDAGFFNAATLPGFVAVVPMGVTQGANIATYQGVLDPINLNNRIIGNYNGTIVKVKPRIPQGYMFCWVQGAPKPLVYRRPDRNPARGDLRLVADNEAYPLRANTWERNFGIGVWNRTNGAVLYTGGTTYVAPTLL